MAHATTTPTPGNTHTVVDALRSILREVTPGQRPFSSDSWLPDFLVEQALAALAHHENQTQAAHQHAFNALRDIEITKVPFLEG